MPPSTSMDEPRTNAAAVDSWATLGGTSAGKALNLAELDVPVLLSTVVGAGAGGDRVSIYLSCWTDLHDYDGESVFHQPFLHAADVVFMSKDAVGDPRALMTRLRADGKRLVVCTLGSDEAVALNVDTNGAGDAFLVGSLAATLTWGAGPKAPAGRLDPGRESAGLAPPRPAAQRAVIVGRGQP